MASPAVYASRTRPKPMASFSGSYTSQRPSAYKNRCPAATGLRLRISAPTRRATPRKKPNIFFFTAPASSIRIITVVSRLSKILGGAKKYVGPISRMSCITVAALSGQLTQKPAQYAWPYEKMWSPTQAMGR